MKLKRKYRFDTTDYGMRENVYWIPSSRLGTGNNGVISSEEDEYDSDGSDEGYSTRQAQTIGRMQTEVRSIIMLFLSHSPH